MPIQTSALKAKIGERIMNAPILPNHPSWLLQYLVKCQIGYPGKAKTIRSPLAKRLTDQGGGKRRSGNSATGTSVALTVVKPGGFMNQLLIVGLFGDVHPAVVMRRMKWLPK